MTDLRYPIPDHYPRLSHLKISEPIVMHETQELREY